MLISKVFLLSNNANESSSDRSMTDTIKENSYLVEESVTVL